MSEFGWLVSISQVTATPTVGPIAGVTDSDVAAQVVLMRGCFINISNRVCEQRGIEITQFTDDVQKIHFGGGPSKV